MGIFGWLELVRARPLKLELGSGLKRRARSTSTFHRFEKYNLQNVSVEFDSCVIFFSFQFQNNLILNSKCKTSLV